ncbi:MAG: hypothetical protein DRJ61_12010 [Acidobacteria bacterium]|nr:MAG: hypothetical protein DRJ61_12010 [Acidobacteriota bacterium]
MIRHLFNDPVMRRLAILFLITRLVLLAAGLCCPPSVLDPLVLRAHRLDILPYLPPDRHDLGRWQAHCAAILGHGWQYHRGCGHGLFCRRLVGRVITARARSRYLILVKG